MSGLLNITRRWLRIDRFMITACTCGGHKQDLYRFLQQVWLPRGMIPLAKCTRKKDFLVLGIDPGPEHSAYALLRPGGEVYQTETLSNLEMLDAFALMQYDRIFIEMIASYGMAVGSSVFDTCVMIGRFWERSWYARGRDPILIYRKDVKMYLCGNTKAKDTNIRQAIMDLHGSTRARAIGTKKYPGPLFGVSGDQWSAIGVALTGMAHDS